MESSNIAVHCGFTVLGKPSAYNLHRDLPLKYKNKKTLYFLNIFYSVKLIFNIPLHYVE